ncbi:MAG: polyprenyl synthetase family protein [Acidobacteriota bacterium]
MDVAAYLAAERAVVDEALDRLLPAPAEWPSRLNDAMRYAVFGGGKRLRPILARAACRAAGGDPDLALEPGCGLELIHTYSLVHDDLPALDDDTLRRGRPTVHVAFDEALAILAGDALLTEGLAVLARYPEGESLAARRAAACALVADAIGSRGMVGGQVEDLAAAHAAPDRDRLERIHRAKTGALISAAMELGALLAGADAAGRARYARFGLKLGLLFQISDDILDVTGTAATLGKSPGKDVAAGKLTYPAVYGLDVARETLASLAAEVSAEARSLSGREDVLSGLVDFIARRDR